MIIKKNTLGFWRLKYREPLRLSNVYITPSVSIRVYEPNKELTYKPLFAKVTDYSTPEPHPQYNRMCSDIFTLNVEPKGVNPAKLSCEWVATKAVQHRNNITHKPVYYRLPVMLVVWGNTRGSSLHDVISGDDPSISVVGNGKMWASIVILAGKNYATVGNRVVVRLYCNVVYKGVSYRAVPVNSNEGALIDISAINRFTWEEEVH